ncbi:MAG: hypothetical protein V1791_03950, partial [Pseudomonadota bacterium]
MKAGIHFRGIDGQRFAPALLKERFAGEQIEQIDEIGDRQVQTPARGAPGDVFQDKKNGFVLPAQLEWDIPRHLVKQLPLTSIFN